MLSVLHTSQTAPSLTLFHQRHSAVPLTQSETGTVVRCRITLTYLNSEASKLKRLMR